METPQLDADPLPKCRAPAKCRAPQINAETRLDADPPRLNADPPDNCRPCRLDADPPAGCRPPCQREGCSHGCRGTAQPPLQPRAGQHVGSVVSAPVPPGRRGLGRGRLRGTARRAPEPRSSQEPTVPGWAEPAGCSGTRCPTESREHRAGSPGVTARCPPGRGALSTPAY